MTNDRRVNLCSCFLNRGFFHGPWLPIYGVGGVLVVALLRRFVDRPLTLFFMTMAVCGVVEYTAGYLLWEMKHMYWWNYSGYFLNLHGRICAEGLIIFGLGGCAFLFQKNPPPHSGHYLCGASGGFCGGQCLFCRTSEQRRRDHGL